MQVDQNPDPCPHSGKKGNPGQTGWKIAEEHRTAIRNIRRDANDQLKKLMKEKKLSEDMEHTVMDQVQEITDQRIKEIDELAKQKAKEIVGG